MSIALIISHLEISSKKQGGKKREEKGKAQVTDLTKIR